MLAVKPRILCVDDDPKILESLTEQFADKFDVVTTMSGADALTMLANPTAFAVVVADYNMSHINGAALLKRARQTSPDTMRILLTGYTDLNAVTEVVNAGYVFRLLFKPCLPADLLQAVDAALDQHRLATGDRESMERKLEAMSQQLLHAERLATLGTMASGIGHELNNATTVFLSLIAEIHSRAERGLPPEMADLTELAQVGEHFRLHGSHLLRLGRPGPERMDKVDLRHVVSETVHMLRAVGKTKRIHVDLHLAEEAVFIMADKRRLEQVLVNLIVNAADATQDLPGRAPQVIITVSADTERRLAVMSIQDNGSGIPEDRLGKIFQPYYSSKPPDKGTGLGLPVVQQIITAYGGGIAVTSVVDEGSTFTCTLPLAKSRL